jgi:hypothetical protein
MADDDLTLPLEGGKGATPERRCSQCKELKDVEDFFDRGDRSGKRSECKSCSQASLLRYRHKTGRNGQREYGSQKTQGWRKSSYQTRRATLRGWITSNLTTRRQQCRTRDIEFTITVDDVIGLYEKQKGFCALTGRELKWGTGTNRGPDTLSMDRIEASGGYTRENLRLVTHWANVARQRFTDAEFVERCREVVQSAAFCEAVLATRATSC